MNLDYVAQEITKIMDASRELSNLYCEVMSHIAKGYHVVNNLFNKYEQLKKVSPMKLGAIFKAKKEYTDAATLLNILELQATQLKEAYVKEQKKLLEVDGLYEAIEVLALTHREVANSLIISLNEIKGEI